jgi:hypothetical protein
LLEERCSPAVTPLEGQHILRLGSDGDLLLSKYQRWLLLAIFVLGGVIRHGRIRASLINSDLRAKFRAPEIVTGKGVEHGTLFISKLQSER